MTTTFSLFKDFFDGEAGLRYEYTTTTTNFPATHIPDFALWAPAFTIRHKLDETQSIKFTYSYRVETAGI